MELTLKVLLLSMRLKGDDPFARWRGRTGYSPVTAQKANPRASGSAEKGAMRPTRIQTGQPN